jgi:hypothetical protein
MVADQPTTIHISIQKQKPPQKPLGYHFTIMHKSYQLDMHQTLQNPKQQTGINNKI